MSASEAALMWWGCAGFSMMVEAVMSFLPLVTAWVAVVLVSVSTLAVLAISRISSRENAVGRTFSLALLFSRMRLRRLSRAEDLALTAALTGAAATTGFAAGFTALAEEGTVFLSDFTGAADFFDAGLAAGEDLVDLAAGLGAGFLGAGLAAGFLGGDFFGEGFDGFTGGFFVGDFFAAVSSCNAVISVSGT